ncbi:MAG: hypothetical protein IPI29_06430 [Ignavibacteria bacterium]|nr:hypothetical protein [Ignavibacteria bacterium]
MRPFTIARQSGLQRNGQSCSFFLQRLAALEIWQCYAAAPGIDVPRWLSVGNNLETLLCGRP